MRERQLRQQKVRRQHLCVFEIFRRHLKISTKKLSKILRGYAQSSEDLKSSEDSRLARFNS
jgi:hypothetical protein